MPIDKHPKNLKIDSERSPRAPEITLPFDLNTQASEVIQFVDKNILDQLPSYLKELAQHSILTQRRLKDNAPIQLATTESIREQILSHFTDSNGIVNEDRKKSFLDRLGRGYVYALDGIRLQAVSSYSELVGNSYIVGNNEVILKAAKKLGCEVLPGIYSGDENLPLFFESENHQGEPLSAESIEKAVVEAANEYYRLDPTTSPYWKQVQEVMTYNLPPEEKNKLLGINGDIAKISTTIIRKQLRVGVDGIIAEQTLRERTLMGAIIDAVEPSETKPQLNSTSSQNLLEAIDNTLAHIRTIHLDDPRYLNHGETQKRWPQDVKDMYARAIASLNHQYDNLVDTEYQNLPDYQRRLMQIHSFAELSVYEPLYSGSLEVRKIQWFENDIQASINQGNNISLFRFADARLKYINKNVSHQAGDYHLIATARIVENAIKKNLYNKGLNKPQIKQLFERIKFYQHYGSFMMTLESNEVNDPDLYNTVISTLNNPDVLNFDSILTDINYSRFDSPELSYRAVPLIVATSNLYQTNEESNPLPVNITKENIDQLWNLVYAMRIQQEVNETGTCREISGNARYIIETLSNLKPEIEKDANIMLQLITELQLIYPNYVKLRPNRSDLLIKYFKQRHMEDPHTD